MAARTVTGEFPPAGAGESGARRGASSNFARRVRLLWIAVFAGCLVAAAIQRFSLPAIPVFDPDTFGYLNPAVARSSGDAMLQTQGRSFLYPAFLWSVLSTAGSFAGVVAWQHVASLVTGAILFATCLLCFGRVPGPLVRQWIGPGLAVAGIGSYLLNAETVACGLQIRPESIFPMFAACQLLCIIGFWRLWFGRAGRAGSLFAVAAGSLALVFAVAAFNLKPSWGFAVATAPAALVVAVVWRNGRSPAWAAAPLVAGGILAAALWLAIPASLNWQRDNASKIFLAMHLFFVHADLIVEMLEEDARRGKLDPDHRHYAQGLRDDLRRSREHVGSYRLLGHNPDFLMHVPANFRPLPGVSTPAERRAFYLHHYLRAFARQPLRFFCKWQTQLRAALFAQPKFFARANLNLGKLYAISAQAELPVPGNVAHGLEQEIRSALEAGAMQAASLPGSVGLAPRWVNNAGAICAALYPLAILLGLTALCAGPFCLREHRALFLLGSVPLAAALLSSFTVAVVHSFDIDRYLTLQAWLAWLVVVVWSSTALSVLEWRLGCLLRARKQPH